MQWVGDDPGPRVVARALKKDRRDRYAAVAELISDLSTAKREVDQSVPASASRDNPRATPTSTPHVTAVKRTRVIVLPFQLLRPDADIGFLSFSLADAIATTLAGVDSLIRTSQRAFRRPSGCWASTSRRSKGIQDSLSASRRRHSGAMPTQSRRHARRPRPFVIP
jgi:hypothetical protein